MWLRHMVAKIFAKKPFHKIRQQTVIIFFYRAFDGRTWGTRKYQNEYEELVKTLDEEGLAHGDHYFRFGYDSPMPQLRTRRNEIVIEAQ